MLLQSLMTHRPEQKAGLGVFYSTYTLSSISCHFDLMLLFWWSGSKVYVLFLSWSSYEQLMQFFKVPLTKNKEKIIIIIIKLFYDLAGNKKNNPINIVLTISFCHKNKECSNNIHCPMVTSPANME